MVHISQDVFRLPCSKGMVHISQDVIRLPCSKGMVHISQDVFKVIFLGFQTLLGYSKKSI
jgi:hypothetical protein